MILGIYNDKGTLTLTLVMQDLATYFFEDLRGQMGQITTLMGLGAFDPEMTLSWIEPCPDVLPLKGGRAVQRGLLPGVRQLNSLLHSSASNPFSLDRAVCYALRKSLTKFHKLYRHLIIQIRHVQVEIVLTLILRSNYCAVCCGPSRLYCVHMQIICTYGF